MPGVVKAYCCYRGVRMTAKYWDWDVTKAPVYVDKRHRRQSSLPDVAHLRLGCKAWDASCPHDGELQQTNFGNPLCPLRLRIVRQTDVTVLCVAEQWAWADLPVSEFEATSFSAASRAPNNIFSRVELSKVFQHSWVRNILSHIFKLRFAAFHKLFTVIWSCSSMHFLLQVWSYSAYAC